MKIPAGEALVHEVGVELLTSDYALTAYLDEFAVFGDPDYRVDFAHERIEHWNNLHEEISQCMYNVGSWTLEKGALVGWPWRAVGRDFHRQHALAERSCENRTATRNREGT